MTPTFVDLGPITGEDWNAWSRGDWPRPKKRKRMVHPVTAADWAQWARENPKKAGLKW